MCFGTTIEEWLDWWSDSFFSFESGGQSLFDESFSNVSDGMGMALELFCDIVIVYFSVCVFIGGEQDIGVFNFLCTAFAGGNEFGEFDAFVVGEGYNVNLFHEETSLFLEKLKTKKNTNSAQ